MIMWRLWSLLSSDSHVPGNLVRVRPHSEDRWLHPGPSNQISLRGSFQNAFVSGIHVSTTSDDRYFVRSRNVISEYGVDGTCLLHEMLHFVRKLEVLLIIPKFVGPGPYLGYR